MNTQDLKEYLGMVVDMEAHCHLLEELRQRLMQELASIEDPQRKNMIPPIKPTQPIKPKMPEKPELPENRLWSNILAYTLLGALSGSGLAVVAPCIVVPCIVALIFLPFDLLWDLLAVSVGHGASSLSTTIEHCIEIAVYCFKFALKYAALPGALIGGFLAFGKLQADYNEADSKYNEKLSEYNRKHNELSSTFNKKMRQFQADMTAYQNAEKQYLLSVQQDNERIQMETANNAKRRSFLQKALADLEERAEEAQRCLRDLYSGDIIFPKYQNLIAVCAIYEYICAGRCSTLGEAYNMLEDEFRQDYKIAQNDYMITQLNCVITQLNGIRANQYELSTVLQSNERRLADIELSNQQILQEVMEGKRRLGDIQSDKLSSYYEELEQKERDYENRKDHFQ